MREISVWAALADLEDAQCALPIAVPPGRHGSDEWQEQIAYYRARAAEYEVTSYRDDVEGVGRRIAALVGRQRVR